MRTFIHMDSPIQADRIFAKLNALDPPLIDVTIGPVILRMHIDDYALLREAVWKYKIGMGYIDPDAEERADRYSDMIATAYEDVYGGELDGEEGEEAVLKRGLDRLIGDAILGRND